VAAPCTGAASATSPPRVGARAPPRARRAGAAAPPRPRWAGAAAPPRPRRAGAAAPPPSPTSLMAHLTPFACLRKDKLLDSLLGDRRQWCWGFLGAAVDEVLGRLGFILKRRRTISRSVTGLRTRVRSGELLATKIMWSQGHMCCSYFIQNTKCPTTPMSCSILKKTMNCSYFC
jgi:hypothetical protein